MTSGFVVAKDPASPPRGLERAVYAIGNFDGLHLGHQAVLHRTRRLAEARGAPSALLTFEPHPADFFAERPVAFRLTPPDLKARVAERLGLSGIVFFTFDAALAGLPADDFVRLILVERLGAGAVVVGWDFHFGKGRTGGPAFLEDAGRRYGFAVEIVAKVETGDGEAARIVSSTAIRRALERGDVADAASCLGRRYAVSGPVIAGQRLGRTLGVPTANVALAPTNRLAHGVYAVLATVDGRTHPAVASFGVRPTVDNGPPLLEVHLLDFAGDLYGRGLTIEFVERIREERKFDSLAALVEEMKRDIARARAILAAAS
ncbi:FMN adenylyltransferase /riboflavin kinase [Roseiarcus fermentans]|uniref:Riboflavin biosynthesis protein n=1 Tax=Roseiarcus fermentans TaxID=1473586 RepID=A0A366FRQ1_9HYPH|nr:bifunctional riboflavin kinase/FAD synthetase [Roseiarcus fermentans]RBP16415.1 FMN adenylyltransferase /riboflavin kinase [Roseiarcus fermentans]